MSKPTYVRVAHWIATCLLYLITVSDVAAHPWGGLVVDREGNIYFTFVCPFSSDDHYACVWKMRGEEVAPSLTSTRSPSDLILARSPSRELFAGERYGSSNAFVSSLWQLGTADWELVVGPSRDDATFHVQAFTIDDAGNVIYAVENQLYKRTAGGNVSALSVQASFGRIDVLAYGDDGLLYVMDRSTLYVVDIASGATEVRAAKLKADNPSNLPFSGANILFDMAVDATGNVYLAYFGNREVLKVDRSGVVTQFLESEGPWSPHGIDLYQGEVYVLESTVGGQPWWKFWAKTPLWPRVRKVLPAGDVVTLFTYNGG
ncbi:MAG: hypothetical protein AAF564_03175 [Bacteroidota bacterium]